MQTNLKNPADFKKKSTFLTMSYQYSMILLFLTAWLLIPSERPEIKRFMLTNKQFMERKEEFERD